jgi:flagellar motility protein MotE (MotC chaperone)
MAGKAHTHVLITLGVLFTVGGVVRILPDTLASAENTSPPAAAVEAAASPAKPVSQPAAASNGQPATSTVSTESMEGLPSEFCLTGEAAAALASDQSVLQARSADFQQREIDLRAREADLRRKAEELSALQQAVESRWDEMTVNAEADLEHLTRMYSAMKPDQAAPIFNQMDPNFAAGFLRLMDSDQAGLILASMQSDKAYVVSVQMANRNRDIRSASRAP